jgi:AcrR family transcriptional regulator
MSDSKATEPTVRGRALMRDPHRDRRATITASESSRRAVLEAGGELLVSCGLVALTVEAVARRANVDRSTISRRWPSEEALAMDVLHHEWAGLAAHVYRGACDFGIY